MNNKPVIGISCGDLNGIGLEIILKIFSDNRIVEHITPVIFASNKAINFYRKVLDINVSFQAVREFNRINPKQVNIFTCWEEDVEINPGQLTEAAGSYAIKSLLAATEALKNGHIDALVTAPIHKKNVQSAEFNYTGHTPFLKNYFNVPEVVMMLCADNFRVAVLTEHIAVNDIAAHITKEIILQKLQIINESLIKDFGIAKPRIAVLGLNPHAGDEGVIGREEETIIKPAIKEAKNTMIVAGPYSADGFFARRHFDQFDAVLAMYHDQGLIPFKALAVNEGVNYTAGLGVVRTSPDHGVAFDIAGKGMADPSSMITAIYMATDILKNKAQYAEDRKNPLKKINAEAFARMEDEVIKE